MMEVEKLGKWKKLGSSECCHDLWFIILCVAIVTTGVSGQLPMPDKF
jgi:hypothetical protein